MSSDVGESVAAINARGDDRAWPVVLQQLQRGAILRRPSGLRDYYTFGPDPADPSHGLGATRVKRLESEGVLRVIGVDTYGLAPTDLEASCG